MKHFILFLAITIVQLGFARASSGQERYLDSLKDWIRENPRIDSQYILTLHRISYRTSESDIKTSFHYYEQVMRFSNELNFKYGKALAHINLGILLSESANYESSNDSYFKAIDYADSANAPRLKSISLNNIGENFKLLKDYKRCREYTRKAVEINRGLGAYRGVAINFEMLFQCDFQEGLYKNSRVQLDSGHRYAVLAGDDNVLCLYKIGYGKLAALEGDLRAAERYLDEAMQLAVGQRHLRNEFYVYLAKAEYLKYPEREKRLQILDSAYQIAKESDYLNGVGQSAQLLSNFYDLEKNKDSSLKYFHIYRESFDTIFSENNKRNVIIKEFDWMIRQKEIENKHLVELASVQKKELGFKNILIMAILALFLFSGVIAFFVYQNIRVSKRRQIAEFEKEMLRVKMASLQSQMNPHFIFNSLNSIENFMMKNDRMAASRYLNKFASLVRTILDSSSTDSIPFETDWKATQTYIELEQLRFNHKFTVLSNVDIALLDKNFRVPPLMIQPYIENAIIHGIAPAESDNLCLKLSAYIRDGYIHYVVEDNGIGRQLSKEYRASNPNPHKSYGIELMQEKINIYSRQNNTDATVHIEDLFEDEKPVGTRVTLKIKVN